MASYIPVTVPAAFRRGKVLFVPRGAALPANCVKCGAAAQDPWQKKFYWHPRWLFVLLLLGLIGIIAYAIISVNIRKVMELKVPLCDMHHAKRKRNLTIGWILMGASIPAGIVIGMQQNASDAAVGIGILTGFVMFLAGAIFLSIGNSYIRPKLIDDYHAEFTGVQEPFLQLVPSQ